MAAIAFALPVLPGQEETVIRMSEETLSPGLYERRTKSFAETWGSSGRWRGSNRRLLEI